MSVINTRSVVFGQGDAQQTGEVVTLSTPEGGEIAVTHLPARSMSANNVHADSLKQTSSESPHNTPIIFVHGMFSTRTFWLSDKRIGLAAHLSDFGYDCWIMERRGMGASGKSDYKTASLMQCIELDLPAVQRYVYSQNPQAAFWFAHSFGGVLNASALAQNTVDATQVRGLINFSSQLTVGKHMINFPGSLLTRLTTRICGYFPSKKFKMGPENEPPETMRDTIRLVTWAKTKKADNYWRGFENITVPILAFGSEGDTVDHHSGCKYLMDKMGSADKQFILLGKQHGHKQDYDHAGIVVSKDAIQEVWPMVIDWLKAH